ncbi:MAG: sigma-70 family RNA polymerase sigma factor [Myxococcales bacterium FL481]|nr:MAG: sigma-70 family RNA polymerase sigma factor [Myxococcales bacterium FL481]
MTTACAEFTRLALPHQARLYRLGLRLTHRPADSQDLVQESLARAWRHWDQFDARGNLGAWLARILYNTFVSHCRRKRVADGARVRGDVHRHLYDQPPASGGEFDAPGDLADEPLAALAALPEHFREVCWLVDVEGLSYAAAARRLGCPEGTIMSRLHRARQRLRGDLDAYARREYGLGRGARRTRAAKSRPTVAPSNPAAAATA